jgi:hypothetical protein
MPFSLGDRCAGPSPLPSPASRARANNSFKPPYRIPSPHWLFALARRQAGEGKGEGPSPQLNGMCARRSLGEEDDHDSMT